MNSLKRWALAAWLPAAMILIWQVAVAAQWVPHSIIPMPGEVARDLLHMVANGQLLFHTGVSAWRLLSGVAIGVALGVAFGIGIGTARSFENAFGPTFRFLAPVPPIAWIPFLIVTLGLDGSKIGLIAIGTFSVVAASTVNGLRETRRDFVEVAQLVEMTWFETLRYVLLPSAAWSIFGGLRVALGLSWVLLLASEVIASSSGLGWMIWDARNFSRPDDMVVGIVWVGVLGFLTDVGVQRLQESVSDWAPRFEGA